MARAIDAESELAPRYREVWYEILRVIAASRDPDHLVIVPGKGWQPHPHAGDREWEERRVAELLVEFGEASGIGPPPPS